MQEFHFKNADFFYTPPELIADSKLIIQGEEFNHLVKVMRKKAGDNILAVNGEGIIFECKILQIDKHELSAEITSSAKSGNEPLINITLALGLLKNPSKYDFVVEKVTELGVKQIIPFTSKFTIAQKPKIERWQNLAVSAMKQSQRAYLPIISECVKFQDLLNTKADYKLIADIDADNFSRDLNFQMASSVLIIIGPEGGLSDEELESASGAGFNKVKLSNMRLRAETAAIISIPLLISKISPQ